MKRQTARSDQAGRPEAASIDGPTLARAFAGAAEALRDQTDAINAINVFPVPDGDTGTNMWMTMRAAADEVRAAGIGDISTVAKAAAKGALMGAKGNSGVILSQILAGIAAAGESVASLGGAGLADALERARAAAYKVVSAPKEGTILTAIAAAAGGAAAARDRGAEASLAAAVAAAREAVARTPELLPVLKEAGVVDSGAQGLYVMLDGMLRAVRGEDGARDFGDLGAIDESWLGARRQLHADGMRTGYCTEFVITGEGLDAASVRDRLKEIGDSVLVIGADDVVRVHVHTAAPDDALSYARGLGDVSHEKVDDMEAQFAALDARQRGEPAAFDGIAVIAVAAGSGLEALCRSMGAIVVRGGQTMNPSAGDIRDAIVASGAREAIVLPNNKNIIMAARQAAEALAQRVRVIETRSVPQGVAALIAHNSEEALDSNVDTMAAAASSVRTAEITLAARATTVNGVTVAEGQPIGIIDGELAVAAATVRDAVLACARTMLATQDAALMTLYSGDAEDEDAAEQIADAVRAAHGIEVEVIAGGQPHYPYLIGLE